MAKRVFVLTGGTSGLGLETARRLSVCDDVAVIAGVRNPDAAVALRDVAPPQQLRLITLDLMSLESVAAFAASVRNTLGDGDRLAGIVCIAGLQFVTGQRLTADGVDESFAANYLGHFALVEALKDRLVNGAIVVTTGSGTHNADDILAKRFGFAGDDFVDAARVAQGSIGRKDARLGGMDRYATSKLCAILYARDMAGRVPEDAVRFVCFDPGLMPGTGLARNRSALERFAWAYVMPVVGRFMPGVSSARLSARTLVTHVLLPPQPCRSGSYIDFAGAPAPRSSRSVDDRLAADLHEVSRRLVGSEALDA